MPKLCHCFSKPPREVSILDYRHTSQTTVPNEVFMWERTLDELYLDSNQIRDLPPQLFHCHGIRKLGISDNELQSLPPAMASLINLEELDFSKNGVIDLPDNIKCCKRLSIVHASVNPLGKLPEGFTQLLNLTQLYLNDTFLDYLPGNFGRLSKLKILELRENHLKTLPRSMCRMTELERLDIGQNDLTELPDVVGSCTALLELWCDSNQITTIPSTFGDLKQLMYFDASKNRIETLPAEIEGCTSLADLHLSTNALKELPETLGQLSNLTTLKLDDNELTSLPFSVGGLVALSELNISANDIEELPASIGLLRNLRTLYGDENLLRDIPSEIGSCTGITVLSLRCNRLQLLPDEIGRIPRLRVLNLSENQLLALPYTLIKLKQLQALWLSDNQAQPLIPLQTDIDRLTGQRSLTCYLLPQQAERDQEPEMDNNSFHPSMWDEERERRQQIQFQNAKDDDTKPAYPKEMKDLERHSRNEAIHTAISSNGGVGSPVKTDLQRSPAKMSEERREERRKERNSPKIRDKSPQKKEIPSSIPQRFNPAKTSTPVTNSPVNQSISDFRLMSPLSSSSQPAQQRAPNPGYIRDAKSEMVLCNFNSPMVKSGTTGAKLPTVPYPNYQHQQQQQMQRQHHRGHHRPSGYESEGGGGQRRPHRASGYESEGGYKSDTDGYRRRHRDYADGYSSDWGRTSSRRDRTATTSGYASDADVYTHRLRNSAYNAYSKPNYSYQQANNSMNSSHVSASSHGANVSVPRTTIRNDELYDPRQKSHQKQQQQQQQQQMVQAPGQPSYYYDLRQYHRKQQQQKPQQHQVLSPSQKLPSPQMYNHYSPQQHQNPYPQQQSPYNPQHQQQNQHQQPIFNALHNQYYPNPSKSQQQQQQQSSQRQQPGASYNQNRYPTRSEPQHAYKPQQNTPPYITSTPQKPAARTDEQPQDAEISRYMNRPELASVPEHSSMKNLHSQSRYTGNDDPLPSTTYHYDDSYKSPEPNSQVSSSTDSGYVHSTTATTNHIYERVQDHAPSSPGSARSSEPRRWNDTTPNRSFENRAQDWLEKQSQSAYSPRRSSSPGMSSLDSSLRQKMAVTIYKNPGLGFSIAGGLGSPGNPYKPGDMGIFVTKVHDGGPAQSLLCPGDKILEVNGADFSTVEHKAAVVTLKQSSATVNLVIERDSVV